MVKCDEGKCEMSGSMELILREVCCLMAAACEVLDNHMHECEMRRQAKEMLLEVANGLQEQKNVHGHKVITAEDVARILKEGNGHGKVS